MNPPARNSLPRRTTVLKTFVVVPCFNEAARLDRAAYEQFLARTDVVLVFVDDGSADATLEILRKISEAAPRRNGSRAACAQSGKSEAIRAGVHYALEHGAECVGYWDADLATPLAEIDTFRRMLEERPELVGVFGSRIRRLGAAITRDPLRHYFGRVFATFASMVLDLAVYDTQCGAKLFRVNDDLRRAFSTPFLSRWIFDVELLARIAAGRRRGGCAIPIPSERLGASLRPTCAKELAGMVLSGLI